MNPIFNLEMIYSFIIIVCSLMVYFGTKELYKLSDYKGLKYFRQAFLFFAVAFFFRSFARFLLIFLGMNLRSFNNFGVWVLFAFMYASTMAIFYLAYSVMWKKWNHEDKIFVLHIIAIIISIISISIGIAEVLLGVQILLFIFVVIASYFSRKKSDKKKHSLYWIYILLFAFWILNIIDLLIPDFLQTFQLIIYFFSTGIFLLILYKVLRRVSG